MFYGTVQLQFLSQPPSQALHLGLSPILPEFYLLNDTEETHPTVLLKRLTERLRYRMILLTQFCNFH